jgi:hypothetical protein
MCGHDSLHHHGNTGHHLPQHYGNFVTCDTLSTDFLNDEYGSHIVRSPHRHQVASEAEHMAGNESIPSRNPHALPGNNLPMDLAVSVMSQQSGKLPRDRHKATAHCAYRYSSG